VTFTNSSTRNSPPYKLGNNYIPQASEYTYLGILFDNNCHLRNASKHLAEKALKSWFSIRSALMSNDSHNPTILLKLFDTLSRPILAYGAEISGHEFITNIDLPKHKWEKTPFKQIHNKVCRNILGIRRNGSGVAAKAELGRFPTLLYIAQTTIKYYAKVASQPSKLTHFALNS